MEPNTIIPLHRRRPSRLPVRFLSFLILACVGACLPSGAQTLRNDWSFNESSGSTAFDSVSGSNITLSGSCSLGGGVLTLPGGAGNYAQLPNGILSSITNSVTIETWLTDIGGLTWARAWSVGGSTVGPNNGFSQANYIDLIPNAGGANNISSGLWAEFNHNGNSDAYQYTPLPTAVEEYVTIVLDVPNQTGRIYLNGVQMGSTTVTFKPSDLGFTYNNFLGLDQYNDAIFNGTFDEMRIWSGAVSQRYISASAAAGAGVLITNVAPTSATLTAPATLAVAATQPATFTVTLAQTGSANLLATADATNWISSNPNILTVSANGMITGVGTGTATVTATVGGVAATSGTITVVSQVLQHEWSFSESGGSTAFDSAGNANIALQGGASLGGGVLTLPGGGGNYAQFPNGILASNYSVTIETWLTDNGGITWARAWSFGGTTKPGGGLIQNNYIDLIPRAGAAGGTWVEFKTPPTGTIDVISPGNIPMQTGTEKYISVTYNAQSQTCIMYSNGVPIKTMTAITVTPAGLGVANYNFLGYDQYNDPPFQGAYDEMRIWDGSLSPVYMLASAAAGPGVIITNTTPQTLVVTAGTTLLGSQTEQAAVTGNFIQVSGLNLTSVVTNWSSSNPAILTVNSTGLINAVSGGSATISATVNGVTGTTALITVAATTPTISLYPTNQNAVVGDHVAFSVGALGGSLVYQWQFNSSPINGATNTTLLLTNVSLGQAGTYSLLVSNNIGTTNVSATLTVGLPILQHEWSFNESGGSTAFDAISGSNIMLLGNCSLGGGVLTLPGGAGNYSQFPDGILSTYSNSLTIETWLTDNAGLTWARPWSFGGSTAGPNSGFTQNNYIDLIPTAGNANGINGGFWTEFNHSSTNTDAYASTPLTVGTEEYVAVTYQVWDRTVRLYLNGSQVGMATNVIFSPSDLGFTYNNFLGLDQWNDPIFNGSFDEMRIWNGAVTPLYELVSAAAGPGIVVTSTVPQVVNVSVSNTVPVGQTLQAAVSVNFPQVSGVTVTGLASNWISSNPNIITVNASGFVTAVSNGTATVSATVNGVAGTSPTITVMASAPVITQDLPPAQSLLAGSTLHLSLANIGSPPFTYFWYFDSGATPISISSSPTLTVPNVQPGSAGNYTCVISNQIGIRPSSVLSLTVLTPSTYDQAVMSLGPIAYWPLDETGGTTAFDVIGGNNGTYGGTYELNQPGPGNTFFGGDVAALFDGSSGHVDIPGGPFNLTNAITVVAWVNLISTPAFGGVIGKGDTLWRMTVDNSDLPRGNDGNQLSDAVGSTSVFDSNWHMLAYSYSGTTGQNDNGSLYVDGALAGNNNVVNYPVANNLDVFIGGSPDYSNRYLPAYVADVAVFKQALTARQIQGIYNGIGMPPPQLISIARTGANVTLTWQTGTLLQSTNLLGPWTTNSAATSGYTVPATNQSQFFKLLIGP
jgi:uncharacterized protein YjdB